MKINWFLNLTRWISKWSWRTKNYDLLTVKINYKGTQNEFDFFFKTQREQKAKCKSVNPLTRSDFKEVGKKMFLSWYHVALGNKEECDL